VLRYGAEQSFGRINSGSNLDLKLPWALVSCINVSHNSADSLLPMGVLSGGGFLATGIDENYRGHDDPRISAAFYNPLSFRSSDPSFTTTGCVFSFVE